MKKKNIKVKVQNDYFDSGHEDLASYCAWLKRKNNVVIHLIENYTGKEMQSDPILSEIRNIILDVSGDIGRLAHKLMIVSDDDEIL